jgi:hypothetical protein
MELPDVTELNGLNMSRPLANQTKTPATVPDKPMVLMRLEAPRRVQIPPFEVFMCVDALGLLALLEVAGKRT